MTETAPGAISPASPAMAALPFKAFSPAIAADPLGMQPSTRTGALDLAEFPGALPASPVANVCMRKATARYARAHGLTVAEWRILGRLHVSSPMQLSTLCRVSYLDKAQGDARGQQPEGVAVWYASCPTGATATAASSRSRPTAIRSAERPSSPEALAEQHRLLRMLTADERPHNLYRAEER